MQLAGELSKVSLPNLLQLVRNGGLTGKFALSQGARTATIFVEQGSVVHAEADGMVGRDAFLELFLWVTGAFSFFEDPLTDATRSLNPQHPEDSTDRLLRDGLAYFEQRKFLDQLRVSGQTVLKPTVQAANLRDSQFAPLRPVLERFDGQKTIAQALADAGLTRRSFVHCISVLLAEGLVVVVEPPIKRSAGELQLPDWVLARLRQDNANITQSIIDMVIWVDRVKCWMYQVDVDFNRIIGQLDAHPNTAPADDDFFRELQISESSSSEGSNVNIQAQLSHAAFVKDLDLYKGSPLFG